MLDLKKLEILVDDALANETEATLIEWLDGQNNVDNIQN